MNHFLNGVARATFEAFEFPAPICEVGAYQVQGQADIADLRRFFGGKRFIGVDMRCGNGVDLAADVCRLPWPAQSVGTLIAMNTFEHVPQFWRAFDEMARVLRPDGAALLSLPFQFHIHNYPGDYWRFTPMAVDLMLEEFPRRILAWHGPAKRPAGVWAVAFGASHPPPDRNRLDRYANLLRAYARTPGGTWRSLRYRMARALCGRGPFAPHLDRDRWEAELRGQWADPSWRQAG